MQRLSTIFIALFVLLGSFAITAQTKWSYHDTEEDLTSTFYLDTKELSNGNFISVGGVIFYDEDYDYEFYFPQISLLSSDGKLIGNHEFDMDDDYWMMYVQDIPADKQFFTIGHSVFDNLWYSNLYDYDLNLISSEVVGSYNEAFIDIITSKYTQLSDGKGLITLNLESDEIREIAVLVVFDEKGKIITNKEYEGFLLYSVVENIDGSGYAGFSTYDILILDHEFNIETSVEQDFYNIEDDFGINVVSLGDKYVAAVQNFGDDIGKAEWVLITVDENFEIIETIDFGQALAYQNFVNNSLRLDDNGNILIANHELSYDEEYFVALRILDKNLNILSDKKYEFTDDEFFCTNFVIDSKGDMIVSGVSFLDNDETVGFVWALPDAFISSVENTSSPIDITISPNPVQRDLNVRFSENVIVSNIQISDMQGRILHSVDTAGQNELSIPIQQFVPGMYNVSLIHADGQISTKKFVKR